MLVITCLHVNSAISPKVKKETYKIIVHAGLVIIYIDTEATVKIIFAPAIVPLITRLEEQFTKYDIQQISDLSSAYAIRLYELLICWRSTGKTPIIELAEFRNRVGVLDTEYHRIAHLKERVIEHSIKQINEHTDITATYEQHKKGE